MTHSSHIRMLNFEASAPVAFWHFSGVENHNTQQEHHSIHRFTSCKPIQFNESPSHVVSPAPAQNPTHLGKDQDPCCCHARACTCTVTALQSLYMHSHEWPESPCFPGQWHTYLTSRSWQDSNLASPMQDLTPPSSLAIAFVGELHHQWCF